MTDETLIDGKLLVWDIETTDFKANMGHLLTVAAKWVGAKEIYSWRIDSHPDYGTTPESFMNDRWIVKEVVELMNSANAILHHYGDRFDLPFLNTRALAWGLLPPAPPTTIDTWKVARSHLALTSNRLKSIAAFLNGPDKQKGGLDITKWKLAMHGDPKVISEMVEYNIGDIIATEESYLKMRPLMRTHPYLARIDREKDARNQCPACGSFHTYSDGPRRTKLFLINRKRCKVCGNCFEHSRKKI